MSYFDYIHITIYPLSILCIALTCSYLLAENLLFAHRQSSTQGAETLSIRTTFYLLQLELTLYWLWESIHIARDIPERREMPKKGKNSEKRLAESRIATKAEGRAETKRLERQLTHPLIFLHFRSVIVTKGIQT